MPIQRILKIGILLALLALIIAGGIYMFQNLIYRRIAHNSEITRYVPDAQRMIKINTPQGLYNVATYNMFAAEVADPLKKYINYPFYITDFGNNQLIIAKTQPGSDEKIRQTLLNQISHAPYPKEERYGNIPLFFYALPDGQFLTCAFNEGIIGISKDYKLVEKMLDTTRTAFFDDGKAEELLSKIKETYPSHTFLKSSGQTSVFGMNVYPDSITFEGYMTANDPNSISLPSKLPPVEAHRAEVAQVETIRKRNDIQIKIRLNKKH